MKLSDRGKALIKTFEGLKLTAYKDTAGVWTIGYGSTRYHDNKAVKPGDKLTNNEQANALFNNTLTPYEEVVLKYVKVPLTQNQFDALVSFSYNEGPGALPASSLLKKLNALDYIGAANQFLEWNKITDPHTGKKVQSATLTDRRKMERALFLKQ